jgi:hypothetical protein
MRGGADRQANFDPTRLTMLFWRQPLEFYALAWRFFAHLFVSGDL